MEPIVCPETSVRNYHYSLCNSPEECSRDLHRGGRFKSRRTYPFLLLLLALQPTMDFILFNDSLPFCSFFTLLSPPSYFHYLHIFLDVCNPSLPWSPLVLVPIGFHSNILFGVLLSSIRITWPGQAILLLFINLTISAFSTSSSVHNSFWFSRIHLHFAQGQRFFSIFYAQIFWDVRHNHLKLRKMNISNKRSRTADKVWSVSLGVGRGANSSSP
jgi:hypothetical protein